MSLIQPTRSAAPHSGSAHQELVEHLDERVRDLVRREGVDPQRDAALVRRMAEGVVREHDERSLTGQVAPVPDLGAMIGELVARVSGFGPLQPYLDDPSVEEIWINDPSRVFVARHGRHELTTLVLTSAQVQELVERMLKSSGRRIDVSQPFVDAMLPEGHRLHVVLEGISRGFSAVNEHNHVRQTAVASSDATVGLPVSDAISGGRRCIVASGQLHRESRFVSQMLPDRCWAVLRTIALDDEVSLQVLDV